jgi:hypothetical protein
MMTPTIIPTIAGIGIAVAGEPRDTCVCCQLNCVNKIHYAQVATTYTANKNDSFETFTQDGNKRKPEQRVLASSPSTAGL